MSVWGNQFDQLKVTGTDHHIANQIFSPNARAKIYKINEIR